MLFYASVWFEPDWFWIRGSVMEDEHAWVLECNQLDFDPCDVDLGGGRSCGVGRIPRGLRSRIRYGTV